MAKKRKIQVHVGAAFAMLCLLIWLLIWLLMLYAQNYRAEKYREHEFLTRYNAALCDVILRIEQFEKADSSADQLFSLEEILMELTQLRAHMNMHIHLAALEGKAAGVDMSGETELYKLIWCIRNGGTFGSSQIDSFQADGAISEREAAVIRLLKSEAEQLRKDMIALEDNSGNYHYALSSVDVYRRLTDIIQRVRGQMLQISQ